MRERRERRKNSPKPPRVVDPSLPPFEVLLPPLPPQPSPEETKAVGVAKRQEQRRAPGLLGAIYPELTALQAKFVTEYFKDFKRTKAAIRAGFSEKSAEIEGHQQFQNPKVRAAIERTANDLLLENGVEVKDIIRRAISIAYGDPRRAVAWGPSEVVARPSEELTADEVAPIAGVRSRKGVTEVIFRDPYPYLALLAKLIGAAGAGDPASNIQVILNLPNNGRRSALPDAPTRGITEVAADDVPLALDAHDDAGEIPEPEPEAVEVEPEDLFEESRGR